MLTILTIVLDGQPYISQHLAEFEKLTIPWRWIIVEGQAQNKADTSWCKPMPPRLSVDGTSEYLLSIKDHQNVRLVQSPSWPNKTVMVNTGLSFADEPGILMQVDSDEIWTADKLEKIHHLFGAVQGLGRMYFYCRYFVGPDIVTTTKDSYGNNTGEWLRAWKYHPNMRFNRHEPPVLNLNQGQAMNREVTRGHGLVFDHFSYALEKQVAYKEQFYGYAGAVDGWKRLQANTIWPTPLKPFMNWVDERAIANKI